MAGMSAGREGTRRVAVGTVGGQSALPSSRRCGACLRSWGAATGAESSVDRLEPRSVGGGAQLSLTGDVDAMWSRIVEVEADNAHLRGMLKISEQESKRPGAAPTVMFDAAPGTVTVASSARDKVSLYANLFRSRRDVYAVRWDSDRTGRGGWMPAVQGGFRKGVPPADRHYLPLTEEVVTRHLSGDLEIGLYPLLDNDRCHWLAADFDGDTALLDALAYLKAARAYGVTAALEVSRSGAGAHVWVFFTAGVPSAQARQMGPVSFAKP